VAEIMEIATYLAAQLDSEHSSVTWRSGTSSGDGAPRRRRSAIL
jgi:hypothetical protein